jgi:hypothetical protein
MAAIAARRWWPRVSALVAALGLFTNALQAQRPHEYQVKAAYLHGFARFVEWPPKSPGASGPRFVVCVLGDDPFGPLLDEATAGAVMKDKPVAVRRLVRVEDSTGCQTLFITAQTEGQLRRILQALDGEPVLTVGDTPQFAQHGGMIGFSLDRSRVRFTINLAAAEHAGLTIQSELLRVAATVVQSDRAGQPTSTRR